MLTTEQLLQPRYRVIADYPDSRFKVGDIIAFTKEKPYTPLTKSSSHQVYYEEELNRYPHLFLSVPWGEERKKEDVPQYLAFTKRAGNKYFSCIARVTRIYTKKGIVTKVVCDDEPMRPYWLSSYDRPATKEEYEHYKSK